MSGYSQTKSVYAGLSFDQVWTFISCFRDIRIEAKPYIQKKYEESSQRFIETLEFLTCNRIAREEDHSIRVNKSFLDLEKEQFQKN